MTWHRKFASRVHALFQKRRLEEDLDEELRLHLAMQTEDNIEDGMSSEEARYVARSNFGGVEQVKEECRERWSFLWLDTVWRDLGYALRTLRKSPGFTTVAVLSLALGIGANTAIFSVVNAVLLRPLPFKDPDRLVLLHRIKTEGTEGIPASEVVSAWKEESRSLDLVSHAAMFVGGSRVVIDGKPEYLPDQKVGTDVFELLGVKPLLGRTFLPEDADGPKVVISHRLWQRRFGGDLEIIGRAPGGRTIVGVMPPGFWIYPWTADADMWAPNSTTGGWMIPIARLKPGVDAEQAKAELAVLAEHVETSEEYAAVTRGYGLRVLEKEVNRKYGGALNLLLGAVGFVLLIACVNVASLLLGRAAQRKREFATRAALGGGRGRLIRQLLTESALLCGLGGMLGVAVAALGIDLFVLLAPNWYPPSEEIAIDSRVLAYTLGISVLTGLLFGLGPAFQASKPDLSASLKEGSRRSTGDVKRGPLRVLAVSETALALILLTGAGLMISSFVRMLEADRGFDSEGVLEMRISLNGGGGEYRSGRVVKPATTAFYRNLLDRIEALPGVVSAGMTSFNTYAPGNRRVLIADRPVPAPGQSLTAVYGEVGGQYFKTLRIPLLKGRLLGQQDAEGTPPVAVVSRTLAEQFFPGENPIGKVVETPEAREIVGVVGSVVRAVRDEPKPEIYVPYRQYTRSGPLYYTLRKGFVIRTSVEPMSLADSLRAIVTELDKELMPSSIKPLDTAVFEWAGLGRENGKKGSLVGMSEAQTLEFYVRLLSIFAGLALFLAIVGLYGVVAHSVARRTHEFGIRTALGADRGKILRQVLQEGLIMSLTGVAIGIAGALALGRLIESILYGVPAADPLTFAAVSAVLIGVALLATYVPARRAAKVDPMVALRHE